MIISHGITAGLKYVSSLFVESREYGNVYSLLQLYFFFFFKDNLCILIRHFKVNNLHPSFHIYFYHSSGRSVLRRLVNLRAAIGRFVRCLKVKLRFVDRLDLLRRCAANCSVIESDL